MNKYLYSLMLMCSLLVLPQWSVATSRDSIKPFYASSMQNILAVRQGKPFILGLWSLSCTHCGEDLHLLSALSQKHPGLDLVLIATDTPEEASIAATTMARYPFKKMEHWIFADDFIEQLRYNIDRQWQGELPRTYFYDATHRARAISGKLDAIETERWIIEHCRC